ncbi:MAG: HflK protein [Legionellales bacterium RIFCSPHIGHO2_12_FULL_35_11]|nr:MAG: HflK protein [Legionellales bacterium RIFCSPHIGHO2_12_FULL_35_11]
MGWNEPGNDKDPWSGKNQPPDLDEVFKRFQKLLKKRLFNIPGKKSKKSTANEPAGILIGLIAIASIFLWALSGIFILDPAEEAVILRFGKYVKTVGPGPHWIPRFICSKRVMNVERVSDYSYSGQMLTKDENLVAVSVAVQYRIGDLRDYLFNVADPEESLRQATSSALRQVVGTTTLDQLITEGRDAWGTSMQESLVKILDYYKVGMLIVNVSPQPARAPENVQDAFDDAIKAQEDEKRFKEQAQAYAAKVVPIAEGKAKRINEEAKAYYEQVILKAKGDAAEFLALLPEYLKSPYVMQERMYLDTMQSVLSQVTKIVVDGKSGNMMYFPLDKIIGKEAVSSSITKISPPSDYKSDGYTSNGSGNGMLLDGRATTRPSDREGRIS